MRILIWICIVLVTFLTSCSNKQYQALFEQNSRRLDTLGKDYGSFVVDYRIKPHDMLQIRNLQDTKLGHLEGSAQNQVNQPAETFEVMEDGNVRLPEVGKISVEGLTRLEAQNQIEDVYRKNLLKDPIFELKITNLRVMLFGEVKNPGTILLLKDRNSLVEIINLAGGLTDKANERDVKIIRGDQKNPQVTFIDLSNIQSINDPHAMLQNGDIVYVPQNRRAIRNDHMQNFTTTYQPFVILFSTLLLIFSLVRR